MTGTTLHRDGEFRNYGFTRLRQLFPCKDGYVVYFTLEGPVGAPFNARLAQWMIEEGAAPAYFVGMDWNRWSPASSMRRGQAERGRRRGAARKRAGKACALAPPRSRHLGPLRGLAEALPRHHVGGGPHWPDREPRS